MDRGPRKFDWSIVLRLILIAPLLLVPIIEEHVWRNVFSKITSDLIILLMSAGVILSDEKLREVIRAIFTEPRSESTIPMGKEGK